MNDALSCRRVLAACNPPPGFYLSTVSPHQVPTDGTILCPAASSKEPAILQPFVVLRAQLWMFLSCTSVAGLHARRSSHWVCPRLECTIGVTVVRLTSTTLLVLPTSKVLFGRRTAFDTNDRQSRGASSAEETGVFRPLFMSQNPLPPHARRSLRFFGGIELYAIHTHHAPNLSLPGQSPSSPHMLNGVTRPSTFSLHLLVHLQVEPSPKLALVY